MICLLGHFRNLNSCFCSQCHLHMHIDYGVYYFYWLYKFWFDCRKRETKKWKKCQAKYRVFDLLGAGGNITFDLQYILSLKWMNGSFNMAFGIVMQDLIKSEMWRLLLWVYLYLRIYMWSRKNSLICSRVIWSTTIDLPS